MKEVLKETVPHSLERVLPGRGHMGTLCPCEEYCGILQVPLQEEGEAGESHSQGCNTTNFRY